MPEKYRKIPPEAVKKKIEGTVFDIGFTGWKRVKLGKSSVNHIPIYEGDFVADNLLPNTVVYIVSGVILNSHDNSFSITKHPWKGPGNYGAGYVGRGKKIWVHRPIN